MLSVLEQYSFFSNSSESRQNQILSKSALVRVAPDTELFGKNCICDNLLLIGSGNLRVFSLSPAGREISLYHVSRGGTCPINILSVLLKRPTSAYAKVLSEITAVTIPAHYFRHCVSEDTAIRDFAFSAMADRLADVIDLVERVSFCTLEQRVASFLSCQFDGLTNTDSPVLSLTHDQIAAELGSAREVISRTLRELERRGGVSLGRGNIRVNDINMLKDIHKYNRH